MRNFIAFLIGITFAALLMVPYAYAETIPATATPIVVGKPGVQATPQAYGKSAYINDNLSCTAAFNDVKNVTGTCAPKYTYIKDTCNFPSTTGATSTWTYHVTTTDAGNCPGSGTQTKLTRLLSGCPSGSTWDGSNCVSGYTYSCPSEGGWSLDGQNCVRSNCVAQKGQTANSGFYLMGTSPSAPFPAVGCYGGCSAVFGGDAPGGSKIIDGVTTYFAEGEYVYSDWACTGQTSPTPMTALPTDTCSIGQQLTQIAGNSVCVDVATGEPQDPDAPCSDVVLKGSPTTNPDGSETTVTTTIKCDGTKTKTSNTTFPDGSSEEETTDETPYDPLNPVGTGGGGTTPGTAADVGEGVEAGIESYCTTNPDAPICKTTESGDAAAIDGIYQSKAEGKTFEGVFDNFNDRIQAAPAISAATQFFDVSNLPSGSCAGLDTSFTVFGATFEVNLTDVFCSSFAVELYSYLNLGVQLVATWLAFTIAFL
ncbi:MAG: hypothetical protein ACAH17_02045 [Candidatus Paceibacterota bacterium]|jgi:hypothetical protein